ncbi:MAG: diguanylate cyclase [Rhodobacterales bacterium]|nr:diguanylate cyclase [Rhodobacterales bacterium]
MISGDKALVDLATAGARQRNTPFVFDLVVALIIILIAGAFGYRIVASSIAEQNRIAEVRDGDVVRAVLGDSRERLGRLTLDLAYWDLATTNLLVTPDTAWAKDNFGPYLYDLQDVDIAVSLSPEDRPVLAYVEGEPTTDFDPVAQQPALRTLLTHAREVDVTKLVPYSAVMNLKGAPHIVGAFPFTPEDVEDRPNWVRSGVYLGALVTAKRLTPDYLERVGQRYDLHDLKLGVGACRSAGCVPLVNPDGETFAHLTFQSERPGDRFIGTILPPLTGLVIMIILAIILAGARFVQFNSVILRKNDQLVTEVSRRRDAEDRLRQQATHDELTHLPNRRFFREVALRALAENERHGVGLALLFLDLDRFKAVNDQHGHDTGDAVLIEVARRLRLLLRQDDLVARLGGDEFCVMLKGDRDVRSAQAVAEKIVATVAEPIDVNDRRIQIGCSVGIALHPQHGTHLDQLMLAADTAMYAIKRSSRGGVSVATTPAFN